MSGQAAWGLAAEDACHDVSEFLPDGPAADDQEADGGDPQQDVSGAGGEEARVEVAVAEEEHGRRLRAVRPSARATR